jgi:arginase family enzyme
MNKQVVIMNFSGVYDVEPFARNSHFVHLDCTHFSGTDGYCDSEGAQSIRSLIAPLSASGVHFIDSGNYHYVSRFWLEKIHQPFSLALFDHHTDMQPPLFEGLLSCGGWVKDLIDSHPWLQHVVLLGIPEEKQDSIPAAYREKVKVVTDTQLHHHTRLNIPLKLAEPLYLSIDKDVMDSQSAQTNWDQGILTWTDLRRVLQLIMQHERVIGVDVCGECASTLGLFTHSAAVDNRANRRLLWLFRRQGLWR